MLLGEIALAVGGAVDGDGGVDIAGISDLENAESGQISFLANLKYRHLLRSTKASAVIVAAGLQEERPGGVSFLRAADPYLAMAKISSLFNPGPVFPKGISPLAYVDRAASCAEDVAIFPFAYVGPRATVGPRTTLFPGCFIGEDTRVGAGCLLYSNVSVRERCVVGDRVILHDGVVVGSDGFGFAPSAEGHVKVPQTGNVVIEDDVEIGANTSIDRATFGSTVIGAGTKLDNLVQVGHNVSLGKGCLLAGQAGISGSTKVGNFVAMGGQAGLGGHIRIGDGARLAGQSGVTGDVPAGAVFAGYPAVPIEEWRRTFALLRRLEKMKERIAELEAAVKELRKHG